MSQLPEPFNGVRRGRLLKLVGIGFVQAMLSVVVAFLTASIFELAMSSPENVNIAKMFTSAIVLLCSLIAISIFQRAEMIEAERLGQDYVSDVRTAVHDHLCRLSFGSPSGLRHGTLMLRFVSDLTSVRQWVSLGVSLLVVSGLMVAGSLAGIFWLSPLIGVAVSMTVLIGIFAMHLLGWKLDRTIREARRQRGRMAGALDEKMRTLSTTNAFSRRRGERRDVKRYSKRLYAAMIGRAAIRGTMRGVAQFTSGLAAAVALIAGVYGRQHGLAAASDIIAAMAVLGIISPRLSGFARVYEYWRSAQIGHSKLTKLFRTGPLVLQPSKRRAFEKRKPTVEFEDASVPGVINQLSAKVAFGDRLLVMGASGSGKSTILHLAMRLVDSDQGVVRVGGTDVKQIGLGSLRRTVSIVSPQIGLMRGTVEANIQFGRKIEKARIYEACRQCEIHTDSSLPGLTVNTMLVDQGANLSSSDWFRVALARALAGHPRVLLLDEVDSHLDDHTMQIFMAVFQSFAGTVMCVSHRASLVEYSTTIWRIGEGRMIGMDKGGASRNAVNFSSKLTGE